MSLRSPGSPGSPGQQFRGGSTVFEPPFALDETEVSRYGTATGYRRGGPKEARLHRVALLASTKEVDHLHPVKVRNIPKRVSEETLRAEFSKFGAVEDVYVPRNLKTREAARDFAVVRFASKDAAEQVLGAAELSDTIVSPKPLRVEPVEKQRSVFSSNSGAHGITNEITEEMKAMESTRKDYVVVKQDITLAECFSRSGYPWGSKQELKILQPHAPRDALYLHSIKLENLSGSTSPEKLREIFRVYGKIADIYCPKPLQIALRTKDFNCGVAFVRFEDRRDLESALRDVEAGRIVVDDRTLTGTHVKPQYWPTQASRRYF